MKVIIFVNTILWTPMMFPNIDPVKNIPKTVKPEIIFNLLSILYLPVFLIISPTTIPSIDKVVAVKIDPN